MTKKYLSARTRTKHTYAFYKERRNNPQWRDDFIQVRSQRRKALFIQTIVILIIIVGGEVYQQRNHLQIRRLQLDIIVAMKNKHRLVNLVIVWHQQSHQTTIMIQRHLQQWQMMTLII